MILLILLLFLYFLFLKINQNFIINLIINKKAIILINNIIKKLFKSSFKTVIISIFLSIQKLFYLQNCKTVNLVISITTTS